MKLLLPLILVTCVAFPLMAWPNSSAFSQESTQEEKKHDDEHEALEKEMKRLKRATRRLKNSYRNEKAKPQDVLPNLRKCQKALLTAKVLFPSELKGDKNVKKRNDYQTIMIDCLMASLKAEKAALAGDMKASAKAFKEMLSNQKSGHDKYRE